MATALDDRRFQCFGREDLTDVALARSAGQSGCWRGAERPDSAGRHSHAPDGSGMVSRSMKTNWVSAHITRAEPMASCHDRRAAK